MTKRTAPSPLSLQRTTFLVPTLHCHSCASYIESFLFGLRPRPISVATSLVSRSVAVEHEQSLSASTISKALGKAGYEADSTSATTLGTEPSGASPSDRSDHDFPFSWLGRMVERWRAGRKTTGEERKKRRHMEHCEQCRAQQRGPGGPRDDNHQPMSGSQQPADRHDANNGRFVVIEPASRPAKVFRASISITGMSCSSCVGNITAALEGKAWVRAASVGLITHSATVEFDGEHDAEELVQIIDGVGYVAKLEKVEEVTAAAAAGADLWRATFSVEGMTCSSCVSAITGALNGFSWAKSVDVNLVSNNATVVIEGKKHLDTATEAIEAIGYSAKLADLVDLSDKRTHKGQRTVSIHIDGMYCEHCPGRAVESLARFGNRLAIESSLSLKDPILTISYAPISPDFTIRAILTAISSADPAFHPSIYHAPTIEERAAQMHARAWRRILYRVVLSVIVAIPAFIIGVVYMSLVPSSDRSRGYLMEQLHGVSRAEWALFILATPVYFFAADIFHRRTIIELHSLWRRSSPTPVLRRFYRFGSMDTLISLGTSVAYFSSVAELAMAATQRTPTETASSTYFDSVVFLTMFLLIGRLIEAYSRAKTGEAVSMLSKLRPKEALLVLPDAGHDGASERTETVPVDLVDFGDVVKVVHGAAPPWDGILMHGQGEFDESSLTGESKPVKKSPGDPVYSGTVNKGGPVLVRTTGTSGTSLLDQIINAVREGQAHRAPIERVADKLTSHFVPFVTLIAIATWLIWLGLGLSGSLPDGYLDAQAGGWPVWSLQFAIAVFVIACPCGIGLAAPTALFVGGGMAARYGILVKGGGEAFQEASDLDIIAFDKTGTLTQGGEPRVADHQFISRDGDQECATILRLLGELEGNSSHVIGKAIAAFCSSSDLSGGSVKASHVEEIPGKGMKGTFSVETTPPQLVDILAGNEALMTDHGISLDGSASKTLDSWKHQAKSVVLVATRSASPPTTANAPPWRLVAMLATSDPLRPESRSVVEALRRRGIDVWMISGDNPTTAQAVGAAVGIPAERILAGVLPEQKADKIKYLQRSQVSRPRSPQLPHWFTKRHQSSKRAIVAMVGDGVNDSPALTVADVGIAIGSGSDIAISAAEFVLINPNLTTILTLTALSRAVFRRVKFNFAWALVYNLVALPIAAGVLYPVRSGGGQHVRLDPVWASLAMALSSISVVCSSLLLKSRLPVVGFRNDRVVTEPSEDV